MKRISLKDRVPAEKCIVTMDFHGKEIVMEWISVKDRVPTETTKCLVTVNFHGMMVLFAKYDAEKEAFYDETGGVFYRENGFYDENGAYKLTAWMPAPKAYDEENSDED